MYLILSCAINIVLLSYLVTEINCFGNNNFIKYLWMILNGKSKCERKIVQCHITLQIFIADDFMFIKRFKIYKCKSVYNLTGLLERNCL